MLPWLKRSAGALLGIGALYLIFYLVDRSPWKPNWNDRVLDRVNRFVPDGWFVDRFAPFDTYELNLTLAIATLLVVSSIIWSLYARVLVPNHNEEMEEMNDGERFRG